VPGSPPGEALRRRRIQNTANPAATSASNPSRDVLRSGGVSGSLLAEGGASSTARADARGSAARSWGSARYLLSVQQM
jgi:hypothetical protein